MVILIYLLMPEVFPTRSQAIMSTNVASRTTALRQPLGQPVAAARNISGVWSREFKAGVRVFLDAANWSRPCIKWNDGSVTGSATDCASYKDATAGQV